MKSTGEILGIDHTFEGALYKALVASGIHFKGDGVVLITVNDDDKPAALKIAQSLHSSGRDCGNAGNGSDASRKQVAPVRIGQQDP